MDVLQSLTDRGEPKQAATPIRKSPITISNAAGGTGGQRFAFIDALRGIAALGVAAYHIYHYGPLAKAAATVTPKFLDVAVAPAPSVRS